MPKVVAQVLTQEQPLAGVLASYWLQDEQLSFPTKTTLLARDLGVKSHELTAVVRQYTRVEVPEWRCPRCRNPVVVSSRSELSQLTGAWTRVLASGKALICGDCRHKDENARIQVQEKLEEQKREHLRTEFGRSQLLDPHLYSLREIVYAVAFVRAAMTESYEWLKPLENTENLAATPERETEIVDRLADCGIIDVHPGSSLSAFEWDGAETAAYFPSRVHWTLGETPEIARSFVRDCQNLLEASLWPRTWVSELPIMLEQLLVDEALQYLSHVLSEYRLPVRFGEKTKDVVSALLGHFDLGQAYSILWGKAKDAAAYYQKGGVNLQQAANTVPSAIQRHLDRALSEGWGRKPFKRPPQVQQSWLSQVFFDTTLRLGSNLYTLKISEVLPQWREDNLAADKYISSLYRALDETDRSTARTRIHELLRERDVRSSSLDILTGLTEDLTMGDLGWEPFVEEAAALLENPLLPKPLIARQKNS